VGELTNDQAPPEGRRFAVDPEDVFVGFDIVMTDDLVGLRQKVTPKPIEQAQTLLCTFEPEINSGEAGLRHA
jgi:hypothetical protein